VAPKLKERKEAKKEYLVFKTNKEELEKTEKILKAYKFHDLVQMAADPNGRGEKLRDQDTDIKRQIEKCKERLRTSQSGLEDRRRKHNKKSIEFENLAAQVPQKEANLAILESEVARQEQQRQDLQASIDENTQR